MAHALQIITHVSQAKQNLNNHQSKGKAAEGTYHRAPQAGNEMIDTNQLDGPIVLPLNRNQTFGHSKAPVDQVASDASSGLTKDFRSMNDSCSDADRELQKRVIRFLETKHVPGLRHLEVKAADGIVTLSGRVYTFYEKQLCNQCCRRVAGVRQLINEVDVIGAMPGAAVVA